jgi:hypothetical protein
MPELSPRQRYVESVVELYRRVPGIRGLRRATRTLAGKLYDRGISLDTVRDAVLLATSRRVFRSAEAGTLQAIATLHYFLPVIDEIQNDHPGDAYLNYVRHRLQHVEPEFVRALDHRIS